jgi:predicted SAM-dependent methyltransferase
MRVTVVDIRNLDSDVSGLTFFCDDATRLSQFQSDSVESISTLNAAEHFGLGRYSDPVDPNACFAFMAALERVLAPNGHLYFAVPVGKERVEFNAHRVFAPDTILNCFPKLQLVSFSYIGDDDKLYEDVEPRAASDSEYACGLFEFRKLDSNSATRA